MLEASPNLLGILIAVGFVGLLPLAVVTMTGFLKISVVLFLIRNALGVQQMPPNLVLYGIALVLTVYVTTPLISEMGTRLQEGQVQFQTTDDLARAAQIVKQPLQQHLIKFTHPRERQFFLDGTTRACGQSRRVRTSRMMTFPSWFRPLSPRSSPAHSRSASCSTFPS